MAQPHLRPRHLVPLLQIADRPQSILRRPEWLAPLLDRLCDCIEPLRGEARVGYQLQYADPLWQIELFLGRTEIIGGLFDGQFDYASFTADVPQVLNLLSPVDRCEWVALPSRFDMDDTTALSGLIIEGTWNDNPVRVVLRSTPPVTATTALRQFPDGSVELV